MKNKKTIYILLPIVLLVWGAVIYQFFSFSNTEIPESQNQESSIKPFAFKEKDTFSIEVNKRDPFLGKMVSDQIVVKTKTTYTKNKTVKLIEELIWPEVKYKGIVSDVKDKIKVYMVIIDGKTFLMKKGDQEKGVKLKDGDRETIYAIYKKDLKVVFIQ